MWCTGLQTPSVITKDQNYAIYDAVPAISNKLPTYNGKNVHIFALSSSFLFINF